MYLTPLNLSALLNYLSLPSLHPILHFLPGLLQEHPDWPPVDALRLIHLNYLTVLFPKCVSDLISLLLSHLG